MLADSVIRVIIDRPENIVHPLLLFETLPLVSCSRTARLWRCSRTFSSSVRRLPLHRRTPVALRSFDTAIRSPSACPQLGLRRCSRQPLSTTARSQPAYASGNVFGRQPPYTDVTSGARSAVPDRFIESVAPRHGPQRHHLTRQRSRDRPDSRPGTQPPCFVVSSSHPPASPSENS
jgi:hypothetical protein